LFIAGKLSEIFKIKTQLSSRFKMKDLVQLSQFLGMEVTRKKDPNSGKDLIILAQSQYLRRILEDFNMANCNPVATPFPTGIQLAALPIDPNTGLPIGILEQDRYRTLVGSLLFASTHTRPDTAFAVGLLSRYLNAPGYSHWQAAKHLLRYINGTLLYGLLFDGNCTQNLFVHSDADFAAQADTRKSTTGYVSILAGTAVTWNSTLQKTVAQSTMEAEYVALAEGVKEALWLRKLLRELGQFQGQYEKTSSQLSSQTGPYSSSRTEKLPGIPDKLIVYSDNDAALILAKNPERHQKAKHIDIKYHFVRDEYDAGRIGLQRVGTAENRADILTKVLTKQPHRNGVQKLGMGQA
jgi:hypothetical protein